ncbi:methylamine utilization protein [Noviherbaspirillum saxi]|uniref:Methylamine utilization protein n=2 Tax=Noviherbaspirillum saxi TaxID=2320863 RepID=A0A3A3FTL6_9BURK|nr:methylamine utilization protein [Noviherbaspirillum saxi]
MSNFSIPSAHTFLSRFRMPRTLLALVLIFLFASGIANSHAASASVQVFGATGAALPDVAVYAEPLSGPALPKSQKTVDIEQKGRKFLPPMTVIQVGTNISFPNNDTVRHHVYSLSPAKVFDLKLYAGEPENPVNFDKPGTVVIGCNIHDQMVAYIHVVPTPYFARTDTSGKARLDGLAPGKYRLKTWHANLPPAAPIPEQQITLTASDAVTNFTVNMNAR